VPAVSLFYAFVRAGDWLPNVIPLLYLPASAGLFIYLAIFLRREAGVAEKNWKTETA
jgi:hypothetical protein